MASCLAVLSYCTISESCQLLNDDLRINDDDDDNDDDAAVAAAAMVMVITLVATKVRVRGETGRKWLNTWVFNFRLEQNCTETKHSLAAETKHS